MLQAIIIHFHAWLSAKRNGKANWPYTLHPSCHACLSHPYAPAAGCGLLAGLREGLMYERVRFCTGICGDFHSSKPTSQFALRCEL